MNSVQLAGRVMTDITKTDEGFVRFVLVVDRKVSTGGTPYADFVSISCTSSAGKVAEKYLRKGVECNVTGDLKTFGKDWAVCASKVTLGGYTGRRNIVAIDGYVLEELQSKKGFTEFVLVNNKSVYVPVSCSGDSSRDARKFLIKNTTLKVTGELRTFGRDDNGYTRFNISAKSIKVGS